MNQLSYIGSQLFSIIRSDGREFVKLSEVIRLKSDGNCTWVYLTDGRKILTSKNLGFYQNLLPLPEDHLQNTFFRVHHQHLINLGFIASFNAKKKSLSFLNGDQLPIAQRRLRAFITVLQKFHLY